MCPSQENAVPGLWGLVPGLWGLIPVGILHPITASTAPWAWGFCLFKKNKLINWLKQEQR